MSDFNRHVYIERARLLLMQKRYKEAEQHAGAVLQNNPDDAEALQIIGHCRLDNNNHNEAIQLFKRCLGINPDEHYVHYLLAFAYYRTKDYSTATGFLNSAIGLNPYNSGYYGLYAFILIEERKFAEALVKANEGLAVNAHDLSCLNARSQALFRLKNKEAAYNTIKEALQVNPDDDFTHTNFGWHFMEAGKHKQAREHFRQALRINPNNNSARLGYKESLKANLPPYRWMLMFSLWLSAKSKKARWAVILGIWLSIRLITGASDAAGLNVLTYVLIGLYVTFVVFSWVGTSIANSMLLLTREGKYVLTKIEKRTAAAVGVCLSGALMACIFGGRVQVVKDGDEFVAALILLTLTLPVSRFEYIDALKRNKYVFAFTIALITLGLVCTTCIFTIGGTPAVSIIAMAYFIASVIYTWAFSFIRA